MPQALQALREQRAEKIAAMRALVDAAAEEDNRDLTADEENQFSALEGEVAKMDKQIQRLESLESMEEKLDEPQDSRVAGVRGHPGRAAPEARREFEGLGEFVAAVRFAPNDQRLSGLYNEFDLQGAGQNMTEGASGGFQVPEQFMEEMMRVQPGESIVRPRARVIPAGTPPDAPVSVPALDQGSTQNIYGGVQVYPIGENEDIPETGAKTRMIRLQPRTTAALVPMSNGLLRNWRAADSFIGTLLRQAMLGYEDRQCLTGKGASGPLGVLESGAAKVVNRTSANDVKFVDLLNMEDELLPDAMPVYVVTKKALKKLRQMENTAGELIWQGSARDGIPPMLNGFPVVVTTRTKALGSKGDIMLLDLRYYLIKDGSGLFIDASAHMKFASDQTVIRAIWNMDGQPWMKSPIKEEDGNTYSPFVVLDVPAS